MRRSCGSCCRSCPDVIAKVLDPARLSDEYERLTQRLASVLRPLDDAPVGTPPWNREELEGLLPEGTLLRPAAVLVGLVLRVEGWQVVLTKRTEHLPQHAGQISFPGGRIEASDRDVVAGALRETDEELGIAANLIRPVGLLDVYGTISLYAVTPVVGLIDPQTPITPDPREVAEVFEVPLDFVLDRNNLKREERMFMGRVRGYYVFPYGDRYIWGATAGMLVNLLERLELR